MLFFKIWNNSIIILITIQFHTEVYCPIQCVWSGNGIFKLDGFPFLYKWVECVPSSLCHSLSVLKFQWNPIHSQLLWHGAWGMECGGHEARLCDKLWLWIFVLSCFWIQLKALSDDSIYHSWATIPLANKDHSQLTFRNK